MTRTLLSLACFVLLIGTAVCQPEQWRPTNGPFGGQMRAVAISPEGEFFAVAWHTNGRSRLYRSIDHGVSYQELTAGDSISFLGPLYCGNGGLVLCGAAQLSGQQYVARSTDEGDSWTTVPPSMGVSSFACDSAGNILCGANGAYGGQAGVFLSTDQGATWLNLNGDLTYIGITGVAFGQDSVLFISDQGYNGSGTGVYRSTDRGVHWVNVLPTSGVKVTAMISTLSGTLLVGTGGSGVLRSTNGGQNWPPVVQGAPNTSVNSFAVDSSGTILMVSSSGVYRSTDDGASWVLSSDGLANLEVRSVASDAQNVRLVADLMSVSQSTDGGNSWFEGYADINSALCSTITCSAAGTLVVATHATGGVYRSTNNGSSWLPVGGNLSYRLVNALAASGDGTLFACVQADSSGRAVFRSTDQGSTWQGNNTAIPKLPALGIATRGTREVVIVSSAGNAATGVFRSTDDGSTWTPLTTGYSNQTFWSVALPPDGRILAGFYGGVAVSQDTGRTWSTIAYGLPYSIVNSLACGWNGRVFATTSGFGVYYLTSDLAGPGWAPADSGLPAQDLGAVQNLAVDSAGAVYGVTLNDGVWRIPPGRLAWSRFASGLIDTNLTGICVSPSGAAFVTTYGEGVFTTLLPSATYVVTNFKAARKDVHTVEVSWSTTNDASILGFEVQRRLGSEPTFASISPSLIPADPFSGSDHRYIFHDSTASEVSEQYRLRIIVQDGTEHFSDTVTTEPVTSASSPVEPFTYLLEQNYPNPFNPLTIIKFTIGGNRGWGLGGSDVSLVVYDVLGRQVALLVHEKKSPGTYEVQFDGNNLASGVYFYRLQAGSYIDTKKLLLIR